MGVSEQLGRGRQVVIDRPGTLIVGLVAVYLVVDLLLKLAGVKVPFLGGDLAFGRLVALVIDGLIIGLALGLAGIGLSMTYSILSFANFGHGDYVTTGAFVGWGTAYVVGGFGTVSVTSAFLIQTNALELSIVGTPVPVLVGLVAAGVGTVALSLLLDRIVYRPMRDQDGIALLIASIGVALTLRYVIAFVWQTGTRGVTATPGKVELGPVTLTHHEITLVVASIALMGGMHLLLQRTKLGKAMRAMADNKALARVSGIPTERIIRNTWIIGGGLTGVAGYLLVLERGTMSFDFGWILLLLIFAAVILGGIGSIYGAMAGGVVIGIVDSVAIIWLPSGLTRAAAFFILIVVLLLRPDGLFGGVTTA